jgi:hypothetical protein
MTMPKEHKGRMRPNLTQEERAILIQQAEAFLLSVWKRHASWNSYEEHTAGLEGDVMWISRGLQEALGAQYPGLDEVAA